MGTPPPEEMAQCSGSAQWAKRKTSRRGVLTSLQGGQRFRLFAELAVPNVIGRLHSELVGREGLEPMWGKEVHERRYLHHLCWGQGRGCRSIAQMGTSRLRKIRSSGDKRGALDHPSLECGRTVSSMVSPGSPGGKVCVFPASEGHAASYEGTTTNSPSDQSPPPRAASHFSNLVHLGRVDVLKS